MSTDELGNKLTMLISTCEKYSDLWQGHMKLLDGNMPAEGMRRILLTDEETGCLFEGAEIFSAGKGLDMPARIAKALPLIKTEYILLTLDDYFLIEPVDRNAILRLVRAMDEKGIDYIRLFKRPSSKEKIEGCKGLYRVDPDSPKDTNYQVNLYPGIWRKSFLEKTLSNDEDAWNYELSLTAAARNCGAYCAMTKGKEFVILDVVRKGKLLHRANAYFRKHPGIYDGDRKVISRFTEIKIDVMTFLKSVFTQKTINRLKALFRRFGMRFYSDGMHGADKPGGAKREKE